jgi:hypothetical protein
MTDADAEPLRDALLQVVQSHRRATLRFCPTYAATLLQPDLCCYAATALRLYGSIALWYTASLIYQRRWK